jgi:hypothetical protein
MFILAHLALGLVIGKITHNYAAVLAGAVLIDADHLVSYAKSGVLYSPRKLWRAISRPEDRIGGQRHFMHTMLGWKISSLAVLLANFWAGVLFSAGYFSHLFLDFIDGSAFRPLKPFSGRSFEGPIKYLSKAEFLLTAVLFAVFLAI